MSALAGVELSRVGYSGGSKAEPTYKRVCNDDKWDDWVETIQVEFDPKTCSFDDVLDAFFRNHDFTSSFRSRQYQSVIFYHDPQQQAKAEGALAARPRAVTRLEPFQSFWDAEAYHQKWLLQRRRELFMTLGLTNTTQLLNSRAATHINAFVASHINVDILKARLLALYEDGHIEDRALKNVLEAVGLHGDTPIIIPNGI